MGSHAFLLLNGSYWTIWLFFPKKNIVFYVWFPCKRLIHNRMAAAKAIHIQPVEVVVLGKDKLKFYAADFLQSKFNSDQSKEVLVTLMIWTYGWKVFSSTCKNIVKKAENGAMPNHIFQKAQVPFCVRSVVRLERCVIAHYQNDHAKLLSAYSS